MKTMEEIEQMLLELEESTRQVMDLQAQLRLAEMRKNDIKAAIIRCYMPVNRKEEVAKVAVPDDSELKAVEVAEQEEEAAPKKCTRGNRVKLHSVETGEEREFDSQTAAALFLDMSPQQLSVTLKVRKIINGWKVEILNQEV